MFFRHEDSPGGAVTNLLGAQIDFVAFKQKIVIMPDWPFFGCILYNVFGEGSYSVIVSARLANLIIISEERWKNDEILFQYNLITYCFCDFWFHGYPCMTKKNVML